MPKKTPKKLKSTSRPVPAKKSPAAPGRPAPAQQLTLPGHETVRVPLAAAFMDAFNTDPRPDRSDSLLDYSTVPGLGPGFPKAVAQYVAIQARIKELEQRQGALKVAIEEELVAARVEQVGCGDYNVQRLTATRSTLDKKALVLKGGVDPTLLAAYTTTKRSSYVSIRRAGEKGQEEVSGAAVA